MRFSNARSGRQRPVQRSPPTSTASSTRSGVREKNEAAASPVNGTLRFCFDLRPRIAQSNGTVEDEASRRRVARVHAEVALALELEAVARLRPRQRRLELGAAEQLEGARVDEGLPVLGLVGLGRGEEMVVEAHLGVHRGGGRNPVNGPLDLTPARVAAAARRIVLTAHSRHLPRGVALDAGALDDVGVAQPTFAPGEYPEKLGGRRAPKSARPI